MRSASSDYRSDASANCSRYPRHCYLHTSNDATPADPVTSPSSKTAVRASRGLLRLRGRTSRGSSPRSVWRRGGLCRRRGFRRGRNGVVHGRSGGRARGVGIRRACRGSSGETVSVWFFVLKFRAFWGSDSGEDVREEKEMDFGISPEVEIVHRSLLVAHVDVEREEIDRCQCPPVEHFHQCG